jgi:hypothetical protein
MVPTVNVVDFIGTGTIFFGQFIVLAAASQGSSINCMGVDVFCLLTSKLYTQLANRWSSKGCGGGLGWGGGVNGHGRRLQRWRPVRKTKFFG